MGQSEEAIKASLVKNNQVINYSRVISSIYILIFISLTIYNILDPEVSLTIPLIIFSVCYFIYIGVLTKHLYHFIKSPSHNILKRSNTLHLSLGFINVALSLILFWFSFYSFGPNKFYLTNLSSKSIRVKLKEYNSSVEKVLFKGETGYFEFTWGKPKLKIFNGAEYEIRKADTDYHFLKRGRYIHYFVKENGLEKSKEIPKIDPIYRKGFSKIGRTLKKDGVVLYTNFKENLFDCQFIKAIEMKAELKHIGCETIALKGYEIAIAEQANALLINNTDCKFSNLSNKDLYSYELFKCPNEIVTGKW